MASQQRSSLYKKYVRIALLGFVLGSGVTHTFLLFTQVGLQAIGVWLGIVAIPYFMYVVAWVFESRRPGRGPDDAPVWKDQSRAFLPGDAFLTTAVVTIIFLPKAGPDWGHQWWWIVVSVLTGIAMFLTGRKVTYSPSDYTPQAWKSPSKRWHDFVMFFGFTTVVFALLVPKLITNFNAEQLQSYFTVALCVGTWVWFAIDDAIIGDVPNPRQHPTVWQPLWKK